MAYKPKNTQERVLHRLKITSGQLQKVMQMVKDDVYCIDILHQMQAVEKAVRETEGVVLENHLKTCVAGSIRQGKDEETIKEVMEVFKKTK
jgi:DNA-binding FrmR family transcriptional regulator